MVIDAWSRYFIELLSRLVLPTHNIVPHISLHDQPCHKTMKKYEYFEGMVISLISPQKFAIQTWFCNCPQYFCFFHIVFECNPRIQFGIFHSHVSIGFSQIAFPITVLPKDDHTDFAQEEQLGLPYWTMILAICRGRRIQMSGHSDFGIFNNL